MALQYIVGEGFKPATTGGGREVFSFSINGVVELPNLTVIGSPRHVDQDTTLGTAKVSAKGGGNASYIVAVKSYSAAGADEITHINDTVTIGTKTVVSLDITTAFIGENRTLELSVQSGTGTFAEDVTITLGE